MSSIEINAFEVPPEEDEAFLAAWDSAGRDAFTLHRALRPDVARRFVEVGPTDADAGYENVREDGDPDGAGGVILINPFEVLAEHDVRFLAGWQAVRDLFANQRGYLGTRLHRSLKTTDYRFVNNARWSSPLMFQRATQKPEFQEVAAAMPFPSHPALYEVIRSAARTGGGA